MLTTFLSIVHIAACIFLILVVLLQQGKSGGLGSAFGGGASHQVFGGRGAGNLLTRLTSVFAGVFLFTSVSLAYLASAGDLKLKAKVTSPTAPLPTTELPTPSPAEKNEAAPTEKAAPEAAPSDSAPAAPLADGARPSHPAERAHRPARQGYALRRQAAFRGCRSNRRHLHGRDPQR